MTQVLEPRGRGTIRGKPAGTVCRQDQVTRAYRAVFTSCSGKPAADCGTWTGM